VRSSNIEYFSNSFRIVLGGKKVDFGDFFDLFGRKSTFRVKTSKQLRPTFSLVKGSLTFDDLQKDLEDLQDLPRLKAQVFETEDTGLFEEIFEYRIPLFDFEKFEYQIILFQRVTLALNRKPQPPNLKP